MNAPVDKKQLHAHLWVRHPDDYYTEPAWCSERLFAVEPFFGGVVDPACGSGRIVRAALAAGHTAYGMDIVRRDPACEIITDFLALNSGEKLFANVVSNPPFKHAEAFVKQALELTTHKVAMLLPSKWIHGDKRSRWLETTPLRRVLFLTPRPSMPPGPVIEAGIEPGGGKEDFAWFVWSNHYDDGLPEIGWLRKEP